MSYEMKRSDVKDFASYIGAETKEHGDELMFKYCPQCSGGHSKDDWTFSINTNTGAFCCQRASCGYKGHFVELCRDFNFPLEFEIPKVYQTLPQPKAPLKPKDEAIKYLESRSISRAVAEKYEITMSNKYPGMIMFPFYNEIGKLMFIKYRNPKYKKDDKTKGSKEWCIKDAVPILFGMKQCVDFERLIITEGQLDSLSVAEAGFNNAVSVPTGAKGMSWWLPCKEWVDKFKEIIIFGDYEHGAITLVDDLAPKISKGLKVVRKKDYLGEKDANDILRKYGPDAIRKCIENAEKPKIDNVIDLSLVKRTNLEDIPVIRTGIWSLDRVIRGLQAGTLTVLTGRRGEGKSTLASQIICSALDQGESVFAYSGELTNSNFKEWLYYQLAGTSHMIESENEYDEKKYTISDEVYNKIDDWVFGRMYLYDNSHIPEETEETESLPKLMERVIKQYGARLLVIDNLMTAMDVVDDQNNLYLAQSNFVSKLKRIAMKYDVAVLLIAHPKKEKNAELDNDSVSGSSDITNKADTVLVYSKAQPKISGEERDDYNNKINVVKNRYNGRLVIGSENAIKLYFCPDSKRIVDAERASKQTYGWETMPNPNNVQLTIDDDELPF